MEPLTPKQQNVLLYIADAQSSRGVSPTRQEISSAFGMSITNVQQYLAALRRKGYVTVTPHAHRGIRLARSRREWSLERRWRGDFEERIGSRLHGETDLLRVFGIVRDEIRAWLDVDRAELFVHDSHRHELRDASFYDVQPAGFAGGGTKTEVPADGAAAQAFRRRRTVLATDAEQPDLLRRERERHPGLVACAALPVKGQGGVLGVLLLEERRPSAAIDEVKLARASLVAAALAPVLEPATLNAELQHRIRLQSALVALCKLINASGDFQAIGWDIHAAVKSLVDAPFFYIRVKDARERWWVLLETDTADGVTVASNQPRIAKAAINPGLLAIRDRPYYILHRTPEEVRVMENTEPGRSKDGWVPSGHRHKRSRSILYVPIKSEGDLIGLLSVQSYRFNAYSIRDAEDLILMSEYIGLALRNAWRMREERTLREAARRTEARVGRARARLARLAGVLEGNPRTELRAVLKDLAMEGAGA